MRSSILEPPWLRFSWVELFSKQLVLTWVVIQSLSPVVILLSPNFITVQCNSIKKHPGITKRSKNPFCFSCAVSPTNKTNVASWNLQASPKIPFFSKYLSKITTEEAVFLDIWSFTIKNWNFYTQIVKLKLLWGKELYLDHEKKSKKIFEDFLQIEFNKPANAKEKYLYQNVFYAKSKQNCNLFFFCFKS